MRSIDADALMDYLQTIPIDLGYRGIEDVKRFVNKMPTIEERKTGKWIITCEFEDCYYAKCNQCNTTQVFYGNKSLTNFCPDCGCDMRG